MSKHVLLALLSLMIALPALGNDESPEALRAQASALRGQAESTFAAAEAACQQRVLVNACISDARDVRLSMIKEARALEIRASRLALAARQAEAAARTPTANAGTGAPDIPAPLQIPEPAPDSNAAAIRAAREEAARTAEARASAARQAHDAEMARARAEREASAARRAEDAARDRERYEIRIRERDAERAGTAAETAGTR